jgi:acyl-CoA oxidase
MMDKAWECAAANVVKRAADAYEKYSAQGKEKDEALEMCSQERFVAAKVHTTGYIYRCVPPSPPSRRLHNH